MAPAQVIETKDLPPEVLASVFQVSAAPAMGAAPETAGHAAQTDVKALSGAVSVAPDAVSAAAAPTFAEPPAPSPPESDWLDGLQAEVQRLLADGQPDVWDRLMHRVESQLILAALATTRGRRIEAAQKLGIGRNTITRKIQELGIDGDRD